MFYWRGCIRLVTSLAAIIFIGIYVVSVIMNMTVVDSDWRFDNPYGSHLQSQSELYHVSWWFF